MARLIAIYKKPTDAKAFDDYYYSTHLPIAKKVPGLKGYEVSTGAVGTMDGQPTYHLIATLSFDSMDALHKALNSPEGAAAAQDLGNFATGGVEILLYDHKEI